MRKNRFFEILGTTQFRKNSEKTDISVVLTLFSWKCKLKKKQKKKFEWEAGTAVLDTWRRNTLLRVRIKNKNEKMFFRPQKVIFWAERIQVGVHRYFHLASDV